MFGTIRICRLSHNNIFTPDSRLVQSEPQLSTDVPEERSIVPCMQLLLEPVHHGFRSDRAALFYYLSVQAVLYIQAKNVAIER